MKAGETWPGILDLVTPEPRPFDPNTIWVSIAPDVLYPTAYNYVVSRLRNPKPPPAPLAELYYRAQAIKMGQARVNFKVDDIRRLNPLDRSIRAETLEILRLYFTEMLAQVMGGPLGLHIIRDSRYKL